MEVFKLFGEGLEACVLCTPKTTSLLLSGKPTKEQKETIKAMVREWTSFAKNMKVKKNFFLIYLSVKLHQLTLRTNK